MPVIPVQTIYFDVGNAHRSRIHGLAFDFVFGYALRESAREAAADPDFVASQFSNGDFPRSAEAFGRGRVEETEDRFEGGIAALLESFAG